MPKLYRRPGSPFWWASHQHNGKQVRFSTGETNRKKAEVTAIAKEDAARGDVPASAAHVTKLIRKAVERVAPEAAKVVTVESHFTQWLARKEKGTKEATFKAYRPITANFLASLGSRAKEPVSIVTFKHVQAFVDNRMAQAVTPQTVLHNLKVIKDSFAKAKKEGLIESNPVDFDKLTLADPVKEIKQPFTEAEVNTLLRHAKGTEWETMILLGRHLGCRIGDASLMKWEHVNLFAASIAWVPEKTDRKRKQLHALPLPKVLLEHLQALKTRQGDGVETFLCPTLAPLKTGGCNGLSLRFGKLMKEAGFERVNTRAEGRTFFPQSFHSLRHTASTQLYREGVSPEDRMKVLGQTTLDVNLGYTHKGIEDLRAKMEKASGGKKSS